MSYSLPFDKPGRFWKGNIHTHSTLSDGQLAPEQVCKRYEDAGYDFVSLTDHHLPHYDYPVTDTRSNRSARFTTIIGAELHGGSLNNGEVWHILAVGLPLDFRLDSIDDSGADIVREAMSAGAFVAVAHPNWYSLTEADVMSLGSLHAVEVFNGVAVDANDKSDSWHFLDILTDRGRRLHAIATDDAHFTARYQDFQRGWVHVKSETLEPDSLTNALKAGHFYSSTGPQFDRISISDQGILNVQCSPVERIFLIGKGSKAQREWGDGITDAAFDLSEFDSPWCRVSIRDKSRNRAWSNPIWLDNSKD